MDSNPRNEPAINATIRAYLEARLKRGEQPADVRAATIAAFVDDFEAPIKSLADQYRREVTAAVDSAIRSFSESPPCSVPFDPSLPA